MSIYYLYVKTHRKTGLKYLGQTRRNPYTYSGSGGDWIAHLKEHGEDISTEIILKTTDKSKRNFLGRYYSNLWRILTAVDDYGNRIWANRIIESGGGGGGKFGIKRKESTKEKLVLANSGKNNPQFGTFWINNGQENRKVKSLDQIPDGWAKGRYFNEEGRKKFVSRSKVGKNNSNYDPTIRHWINIETGEEISLPKYDFCQQKMLNGKKIRAVVQGKIEHYRGWKLKSF